MLVDAGCVDRLHPSAWPGHLELIDGLGIADAEPDVRHFERIKASTRAHPAPDLAALDGHHHARAESLQGAIVPDELHFQPVGRSAAVEIEHIEMFGSLGVAAERCEDIEIAIAVIVEHR